MSTKTSTSKAKKESIDTENQNLVFQEVKVMRQPSIIEGDKVTTKFERLKVIRPKVRIRQEEANVINKGVKEDAGNTIFSMYLLPDEEVTDLVHIIKNK